MEIVNGGFETGDLTGWYIHSGNPIVATDAKHSGTYGARISSLNHDTQEISQGDLNIIAGEVLTFWYRINSYSASTFIQFYCYSSEHEVTWFSVRIEDLNTDGNWHQYISNPMPDQEEDEWTDGRLAFITSDADTEGGVIDIDDVSTVGVTNHRCITSSYNITFPKKSITSSYDINVPVIVDLGTSYNIRHPIHSNFIVVIGV